MAKTKKTYSKPSVQLKIVRQMFADKEFIKFKQLIEYVPRSTIADQLAIGHDLIEEKIKKPEQFKLIQLKKLAKYLGVPYKDLVLLAAGIK